MKIINKTLNIDLDISKYLYDVTNTDVLLFDIETTGFIADKSTLYLIGCVYNLKGSWTFTQFFADNFKDEVSVLSNFFNLCKDFKYIVHFNGDTFDIPYISKKSIIYNVNSTELKKLKSIDLYKIIKKYKHLFNLENLKQKTLERFVGINRNDKFSGGELIEQYKLYTKNLNKTIEKNLLLHNEEDLYGMLGLLKIIDYTNYISSILNLTTDNITNCYIDNTYLNVTLTVFTPIPLSLIIQHGTWKIMLTSLSTEILIMINIKADTLLHFFSDYQNYYYIVEKDEAIHKSVGKYLEPSKRIQANKNNSYIKKTGCFIETFVTSTDIQIFKKDTLSNNCYIYISKNLISKELILRNLVKILDK
ncbi:MAG TPA: exonuclease [Clostridiales bacterium]|nr:MAG: hypothetical protein A2Y22_07255 [Clostridiales bacterium GWD2_32_59]HAN09763.1 exonuclease [Clostridiales bacterium]